MTSCCPELFVQRRKTSKMFGWRPCRSQESALTLIVVVDNVDSDGEREKSTDERAPPTFRPAGSYWGSSTAGPLSLMHLNHFLSSPFAMKAVPPYSSKPREF